MAIVALIGQCVWYKNYREELTLKDAQYQTYAYWHTVTVTDDFTEESTSYDMVYSTLDGKVNSHVILAYKDGKYLLLSQWGSDVGYSFIESAAVVEVKIDNSVKTVKLKRLHDSYEMEELITPENKKVKFMETLVFPQDIVPDGGVMQIRMKDKVYSFNLDREL